MFHKNIRDMCTWKLESRNLVRSFQHGLFSRLSPRYPSLDPILKVRSREHRATCFQALSSGNSHGLELAKCFTGTKRSFATSAADSNNHDFHSLFDPYLPRSLRLQNGVMDVEKPETIKPVGDLIEKLFLMLVESHWKFESLSQLGLHQNRWSAFIWLIKTILSAEQPLSHYQTYSPLNGWNQESLSLDELTSDRSLAGKISRQSSNVLEQSLESILRMPQVVGSSDGLMDSSDSLGYLWMSLGSVIIHAVNMDTQAAASVMTNVYQAIALMHHSDVIPQTIYNYGSASDVSAIQRPPTLRLLHSRILTILSDAAWTAEEAQILKEAETEGAKFTHKGYELPGAEYRPRIRSIGLEVWLEFVLWSCVESGRISQASWIIGQLIDSEQSGMPWSVMSWASLRQRIKSGYVNVEGLRNQFKGAASTSEGYSEESPPILMDTRTVSSEVIQAIFDGLHSIINNRGRSPENTSSLLLNTMKYCRDLLVAQEVQLRSDPWDRTLLRLSEGVSRDLPSNPSFLSLVPNSFQNNNKEQRPTLYPSFPDESSAMVGLLHIALERYLDSGLLAGSLQAFQQLLDITDNSRANLVESFIHKSSNELKTRSCASMLEVQETENFRYTAFTKIPDRILASFLDLLSNLRLYPIGQWLLASNDIDGPTISQEKYASRILQPALLRFAAATSDVELLSKVAASLPTPLSEENTIALLQCQIALRQWDRVNDILLNAKRENFAIPLAEISRVAHTIVIDEHIKLNDVQESSLVKAEHILVDLITGTYDQEANHSKTPEFLRRQQINQLNRILASLPGRLTTLVSKLVQSSGQDHATTIVDSKAFDPILDGVVQAFGSSAGKHFWQRWCIPPRTERIMPYTLDEQEKVVRPTIQTLNFILAPLTTGVKKISHRGSLKHGQRATIEEREDGRTSANLKHPYKTDVREKSTTSSQTSLAIDSWAVSVLREFGLEESTIAAEMELYMLKGISPKSPQRRKV